MNKVIIPLLILLIIAPLGYLLFKQTIGDIQPAVVPNTNTEARSEEEILNSSGSAKLGLATRFPITHPDKFQIGIFAEDLRAPRDLELSPQGVLLASIPSEGRVVALPDKNNDGVAEDTVEVVTGLTKPHGLAFYNGNLFIAESNKISRYSFNEATLKATLDKKLFDLPDRGNHDAHTVMFDSAGRMLVKVGSSCNVCVEEDNFRATIISSNANGDNPTVFAQGLRNAPFFTVRPGTDEVWVTEMSRDLLGDDLPPDEINIVKEGGKYGWPYCYGNKVLDTNFYKGNNVNCADTIPPVYEIPAHSAPLGLTFIPSGVFPADWEGDLLVSYHGSWNRSVPTGYKVVRLSVDGSSVTGTEDFLTGFLKGSTALGRPVDLLFNKNGNLFISDDKAGNIYIVSYKK